MGVLGRARRSREGKSIAATQVSLQKVFRWKHYLWETVKHPAAIRFSAVTNQLIGSCRAAFPLYLRHS